MEELLLGLNEAFYSSRHFYGKKRNSKGIDALKQSDLREELKGTGLGLGLYLYSSQSVCLPTESIIIKFNSCIHIFHLEKKNERGEKRH